MKNKFRYGTVTYATNMLRKSGFDKDFYLFENRYFYEGFNNYNNIKYTIDKYKKTIDDIQSNIKVLDIILNEISPKNGLIAKSVSSFLNIIIENINAIINTVWDYKMILKAINVEDEVLNYKFKVEVEDKITINDVNNCSSGMKKIINFAFI